MLYQCMPVVSWGLSLNRDVGAVDRRAIETRHAAGGRDAKDLPSLQN